MMRRLLAPALVVVVLVLVGGCAGMSPDSGSLAQEVRGAPAFEPPRPPPGLIDDVGRALAGADHEAPRGGEWHLPSQLPAGVFPDYVEVGYEIMVGLRNGDDEDRLVAKAACYAMKKAGSPDQNPRAKSWQTAVYDGLPPAFRPGGEYNYLVKSQVERASTALGYAQNAPGGVSQYYGHYCLSWTDVLPG